MILNAYLQGDKGAVAMRHAKTGPITLAVEVPELEELIVIVVTTDGDVGLMTMPTTEDGICDELHLIASLNDDQNFEMVVDTDFLGMEDPIMTLTTQHRATLEAVIEDDDELD